MPHVLGTMIMSRKPDLGHKGSGKAQGGEETDRFGFQICNLRSSGCWVALREGVFFLGCVFCNVLCFNFFRSLRQIGLVRHIARALVQQAEGEDQCDTIQAQVLDDCGKHVRNTLIGFFRA